MKELWRKLSGVSVADGLLYLVRSLPLEDVRTTTLAATEDYAELGSPLGIPQNASRYRMNFWHTNAWSVETNPLSLEKPRERCKLEVDWMSYEPMKK